MQIKYDGNKEGYIRGELLNIGRLKKSETMKHFTDEDVRSFYKETVDGFFDMDDLKSVYFADVNEDNLYECYVTSFSNGAAIFYPDGYEVAYFIDDISGNISFSLDTDSNIVINTYFFGSYSGAAFYEFDGMEFEEVGFCYQDELENRYYVDGDEVGAEEEMLYIAERMENAVTYEGTSDLQ